MTEIVVSAILPVLFEKLADEALKKYARVKGIDAELKKWKRLLTQIRALLNDASQKEITDEAVKEWLNGLHHLVYDIDDVLDDLEIEAAHHELTEETGTFTGKVRKLIHSGFTKFSWGTEMHAKLDTITAKLQELEAEKAILGLIVKGESPKLMNRRLQTSLVDASSIVGREGDKDALLLKLLEDESCDKNYSIVPIVGMGGVGKTTLARLLYDEKKVKDHFELKAWVCVSDEFDIFSICKTILQSIDGEIREFSDLNLLQVALKEKLEKKRFLLVLDDVWSESYTDWEILEGPFLSGAPGSKIIMTTRKQSLLTQLGYDQPYLLSVLSHDKALSLFCQHALGENNFDSHAALKPLGEGIVEKCDGLPLALIALGRLLRTKTDEKWKEVLDSEIWRSEKKDGVIPALRLSYYDLSASLKQLFAYCSLFPKDFVFDKEQLVLLWMAEGFLQISDRSKSMFQLGTEYFEELLSRTFFQHAPNDESYFVMHDIMNDLATSVAGDVFSRLEMDMKKLRREALEKYRHMSFIWEDSVAFERFKTFEGATSLRTFLSLSCRVDRSRKVIDSSNKILGDLFHRLPLLRVLNLSHLMISEVPESIGGLKHLRYLNLNETRITSLPEVVCSLLHLQTLIVSYCRCLERLPKSLSKLKNLQHFDLRGTPHLKMPLGIGELKSLRSLLMVLIEGDNGFSISELKDLNDLQGIISIKGLDKVPSLMHAQEANFSRKRVSELRVEWSEVFDGSRNETVEKDVLNVLKPQNDNLKKLEIRSYGGVEFPNWVGSSLFLRLAHVRIQGCKKCTSLPPLGQLPSLKRLQIEGMDEVNVVGSEFLGTGLAFPSLEFLSFEKMPEWESWSTSNGFVDAAFPCLRKLKLYNCPNLDKVSFATLPSLRDLVIDICGSDVIKSLVRVASSVTKFSLYSIPGLTDQLWGGFIEYLGAVEVLRLRKCDELRYLWESEAEASKVLVNLRELDVSHCSRLVSLGEKEEDNCGSNLTSLRELMVYGCRSMERCSCPNSIEKLEICLCDSLTSISFPPGEQKLKSLVIWNCKKLLEEELGRGETTRKLINSSMRMLESIDITSWPNLKSIIQLSCFIHLNTLRIEDCPNMESFAEQELPNLTALRHMRIKNCPSMNASFPCGLWPPKLQSLGIGGLKKSISQWGPQKFPTSLVTLELVGRQSDDVRNGSQLSDLLPSSLTALTLYKFEKLESLSMGLQHLTSLQHLSIYSCPQMIDLPKAWLPSPLYLSIGNCPNLKENGTRFYMNV